MREKWGEVVDIYRKNNKNRSIDIEGDRYQRKKYQKK